MERPFLLLRKSSLTHSSRIVFGESQDQHSLQKFIYIILCLLSYEIPRSKESERFFSAISFDRQTALFFSGKMTIELYNYFLEIEKPPQFFQIFMSFFAQKLRDVIPTGNYYDQDRKALLIPQILSNMLDFPLVSMFSEERHHMVYAELSEELKKVLDAPLSDSGF
jgi:hypothetical protein